MLDGSDMWHVYILIVYPEMMLSFEGTVFLIECVNWQHGGCADFNFWFGGIK